MVTPRSLCAAATPCLERSPEHKAEVRVYLSYTSLSQASLLLTLLIRLLYMFTHTTAERMIMSLAHVVTGPPRRINNIPSVYVTRRWLKQCKHNLSDMAGVPSNCVPPMQSSSPSFLEPALLVDHHGDNGDNPFHWRRQGLYTDCLVVVGRGLGVDHHRHHRKVRMTVSWQKNPHCDN